MNAQNKLTLAFASLAPLAAAAGVTTVSVPKDTELYAMSSALQEGGFTMWSGPLPSDADRALFDATNEAVKADFGLDYLPLLLLVPDQNIDPSKPEDHDRFVSYYGAEIDRLAGQGIFDVTGPLAEPWQGTNSRDVWFPPLAGAALRTFQSNIAAAFIRLLKGRKGSRVAIEYLCPREHHTMRGLKYLLPVVRMINAALGDGDGRAYVLPDTAHTLWAPHNAPDLVARVDLEESLHFLTEALSDGLVFCSHWSYPDIRGAVEGQPLEGLMVQMLTHTLTHATGDQIQVVEVFRPELEVIRNCLVPAQTFAPEDYYPLHVREAKRIAAIHAAIVAAA